MVHPLYGTSRWGRLPVMVSVVLIGLALVVAARVSGSHGGSRRMTPLVRKGVVALTLFVYFAFQVRLGSALRFPNGWDAQGIQNAAEGLASGTLPPEALAGVSARATPTTCSSPRS